MRMTHSDYLAILSFYSKDSLSMTKSQIKETAEQLLADKLCRCIKKVQGSGDDETRAIAICTDSVLRKKNLKGYGFRCKKGAKLLAVRSRRTSRKLSKIRGGSRITRKC